MEDMGILSLHMQSLTKALDDVGGAVQSASAGLQVKMDKAADRLGSSIGESVQLLVASLDSASAAAKEAAAASNTYSKRLLFATWALVGATVVLAAVTAVHG
jgi:hypothetical protein